MLVLFYLNCDGKISPLFSQGVSFCGIQLVRSAIHTHERIWDFQNIQSPGFLRFKMKYF